MASAKFGFGLPVLLKEGSGYPQAGEVYTAEDLEPADNWRDENVPEYVLKSLTADTLSPVTGKPVHRFIDYVRETDLQPAP